MLSGFSWPSTTPSCKAVYNSDTGIGIVAAFSATRAAFAMGESIVRIFRSFTSSGFTTCLVLVVRCRSPYHQPISRMRIPVSLASRSFNSAMRGPRATLISLGRSSSSVFPERIYGIPSTPIGPQPWNWASMLGPVKEIWMTPFFTCSTMSFSLPSWLAGNTCTVTAPFVRSFINSANLRLPL